MLTSLANRGNAFIRSNRIRLRFVIRGVVALVAIITVSLFSGVQAFAVGSGYGSSAPPSSASAAGFSTVVATQTFSSSGGTINGSANGATASVTIPSGSLPNGGQVVISAGTPSSVNAGGNVTVVTDFSIVILNPSTGAKLNGPFSPPLTVNISDPSIVPGDSVVSVTAPGVTSPVTTVQITKGQAVITFTTDPNFAVVSSLSASVTGATSVTTGKPFLGEALFASILLIGGIVLLALARRRRYPI